MALPLRVTVSPQYAEAAPGDSLTLVVNVRNASDIVEHYGIEVLGLPVGAAVRAEPEVAKLRPSESADLTLYIALPEKPPPVAGGYLLGVLARSRYREDVSRCVEVPLTLAAVQDVTIRVAPEVVTGGRAGRYTVEVANGGNGPLRLRLTATDPERRVAARFDPAVVDLRPGTAAHALLVVQAPVPWNREKDRRLTIEVAGPDPGGGPTSTRATATATFVQRPRLASKLTRIAGLTAAIAALVGAAVGAAVILRPDSSPTASETQQTIQPTAAAPVPTKAAPTSAGRPSNPATATSLIASSPPSPTPTEPPTAREVDLTRLSDGPVSSDAYRPDGFNVTSDVDSLSVPGCEAARPTDHGHRGRRAVPDLGGGRKSGSVS